jgi:hypothetical protein
MKIAIVLLPIFIIAMSEMIPNNPLQNNGYLELELGAVCIIASSSFFMLGCFLYVPISPLLLGT